MIGDRPSIALESRRRAEAGRLPPIGGGAGAARRGRRLRDRRPRLLPPSGPWRRLAARPHPPPQHLSHPGGSKTARLAAPFPNPGSRFRKTFRAVPWRGLAVRHWRRGVARRGFRVIESNRLYCNGYIVIKAVILLSGYIVIKAAFVSSNRLYGAGLSNIRPRCGLAVRPDPPQQPHHRRRGRSHGRSRFHKPQRNRPRESRQAQRSTRHGLPRPFEARPRGSRPAIFPSRPGREGGSAVRRPRLGGGPWTPLIMLMRGRP